MSEPISSSIAAGPEKIAEDTVGGRTVVTSRLPYRSWRTKLFETAVLDDDAEALTRRYETREQAEAGHAEVVAELVRRQSCPGGQWCRCEQSTPCAVSTLDGGQ